MSVVNLLPGPVPLHPGVREVFAESPVSHRGAGFMSDLAELRDRLRALVNARHVELLLGSGTLANDAVAAQLSLHPRSGLVLVNGEFGERLEEQARRFGLRHRVLAADWGKTFDLARLELEVESRTAAGEAPGWLWAVHCETSTGVLNDLGGLKALCRRRGLDLALDCISSIGTVAVDLAGVRLATCVSGKGLASLPGLAMVFHEDPIAPAPRLPRYLDLGYYAAKDGVPFTTSSNLVYALRRSLELRDGAAAGEAGWERENRRRAELSGWLRAELTALGWRVLAPAEIASPAVLSLMPDGAGSALELGEELERRGFLLSYRSEYLVRRNLIQICLMGEHSREELEPLVAFLARWGRHGAAGAIS